VSQHPTMTTLDETDSLRREAKDWVVDVATGAVTKSDLLALEQWRAQSPKHAEAYAEACQLWQALGAPLEAAARDTSSARRPVGARHSIGRRAVLTGALAASAAGAAVLAMDPPFELWPSMAELAADYHTGVGEQRQIMLAGDASVELNTRSSLNVRGQSDVNTVELVTGEAAIAAASERFTVLTAKGQVSAIDAKFMVRRDGATVRVTCLSGVVDVVCQGQGATVQPGEQLAYTAEGLGRALQIDPEIAAGWRSGLLIFENERLSHVIEEVNRYRSGRIILTNPALGERRISARFKLARLDAVLTQFQAAFGVKVTALPRGFVLLS
jgi:transmembrane sensor